MEVVLISAAALGASAGVAYVGSFIAQNVAKYFLHSGEFSTEKISRSDLRAGDHIFVPGVGSQALKMKGLEGYYHHGVYLGKINGQHLITDFGVVSFTRPAIRKLDDFIGKYSNQLYRRNYSNSSRVLPIEKTLRYAKLICEDARTKNVWPKYNLLSNNCEHYASLIKMESVYSDQTKHLPQDVFYENMVVPTLGKKILKPYSDDKN